MRETIIDYNSIGKRIKAKRLAQGLTQEQLGEKVNLSITHISHIETGRTKLSVESLINLSNALHVSVDELLQDNLSYNDTFYYNEIDHEIKDCSPDEVRDIALIIKYFKAYLRTKREKNK